MSSSVLGGLVEGEEHGYVCRRRACSSGGKYTAVTRRTQIRRGDGWLSRNLFSRLAKVFSVSTLFRVQL